MASGDQLEAEKRLAAEAAAELVADHTLVGLGSGSTVACLLPALAGRRLTIRCVASSPQTERSAGELGLQVEAFDRLDRLDIAIDGADQVDPEGWLIKGGGGAHTREKIVAAAADRFVVIVDSSKPVEQLRAPVPLELHRFGLAATRLELGPVELRERPPSPDGGLIADYAGELVDPAELAARLDSVPGVVAHGLFPPRLTSEVLVAGGGRVETIEI